MIFELDIELGMYTTAVTPTVTTVTKASKLFLSEACDIVHGRAST